MSRNLRRMPVKLDPEKDHGYDAFPTSGDVDRASRHAAWCLGWKHGACGRVTDSDASLNADQGIASAYNVGYRVGEQAFVMASKNASTLFGYVPRTPRRG
jgi:hypothetical protein